MSDNLKVAFQTYGCRSNFADTVDLVALASEKGVEVSEFTKDVKADVYVINSCTVTDSADREAIKLIKKLQKDSPSARFVLTGCLAEAKTKEMQELFPGISVIGPGQKKNVINAIIGSDCKIERPVVKEIREDKLVKLRTPSHKTISLDEAIPEKIGGPASYIGDFKLRSRFHLRVQEGCENHCTFCIIPQTRGVLSSRAIKDILIDLEKLDEVGYKEVVLTGTHLGGYGQDINESLLSLLKAIENESKVRRIRLSSLDPNDVSFEIIDFLSKSNVYCPHLHICLQAFTDNILKRMNRKYRMEDAKELLWYIHSSFKGIGIGSDVITGFPGECRKELEEGMEEFLSLPISYLHVFPYSEREGTAATRLDQTVAHQERKRRAARWRALSERKNKTFLSSLIGKELDVVIEDKTPIDGSRFGTSGEFANVLIPLPENKNKVPWLKAGSRVIAKAVSVENEGIVKCELLNQVN